MIAILVALLLPVADPAAKSAKDALQPMNPLVGSWKATGYPDGTKDEREKGFWTETIAWGWQFKGPDAWLTATIEKGKHFTAAEIHYQPDVAKFLLKVIPVGKDPLDYVGLLTTGKNGEQILTAERTDPESKETQRIVMTILHHNRFLYRYEAKPPGASTFARKYQVGATKEGEPFANVPTGPECIVSGGKGTIAVTHQGKTYYVCCSGCRDEFKGDPEKYIKAYEAKKK